MLEVGQGASLGSFPKSMPGSSGFGEAEAWLVTVQPRLGQKEQDWWMGDLGEYKGQIRV